MPLPTEPQGVLDPASSSHAYWQSAEAGRFFNKVAFWVTSIMLAYVGGRVWLDGSLAYAIGPLIIALGGMTAWLVRRRGRAFAGFLVYVWGVWVGLSTQSLVQAGLANSALHGYLLLMVATGWMLGIRHAIAVGVASIVFILGMAVALQYGGWSPSPPLRPVAQAMAIVMTWVVALILLGWILRVQQQQLEATQVLNEDLTRMVVQSEEQNAALRASEQRFAIIIKASPLPIAISRLEDGRYIDVNPAWEREVGWTRDEAIKQTSVSVGFWSCPEQRVAWIEQFRKDGRSVGHEVTVRRRDGTERTALLSAELIDYSGEPVILAVVIDVTERKRIEVELHILVLLVLVIGCRTANAQWRAGGSRRRPHC